MKEAIKLVLKEGTTFDLYFLDGVVKRYNILSLAKKFPALNALKDRKLFEQGKLLGWGGVVWNDELDVSSETVYEDGKDVTKEYDDIDSVVLGYKIKVKRTIRLMTQEELCEYTSGEAITLTAVMAILATAVIAVVVYRLFLSKKGSATVPGGWKFTWN